jgi:hypothetical protein
MKWWIERLGVGIEALEVVAHRERARADFYEEALKWALGEGGLPVDKNAEWAACVWYSIWLRDDEQDVRLAASFERIRRLMVNELREVPHEELSLRWAEVVGRLWLAYRLRVAWQRTNRAQRAIVEGNVDAALDSLEDASRAILIGQDELDETRGILLGSEDAA